MPLNSKGKYVNGEYLEAVPRGFEESRRDSIGIRWEDSKFAGARGVGEAFALAWQKAHSERRPGPSYSSREQYDDVLRAHSGMDPKVPYETPDPFGFGKAASQRENERLERKVAAVLESVRKRS